MFDHNVSYLRQRPHPASRIARVCSALASLALLATALPSWRAVAQTSQPPLLLGASTAESDPTFSVAWGDYDRDGDLDLAVGNYDQPDRLYRNDGGALIPIWAAPEITRTTSVAW